MNISILRSGGFAGIEVPLGAVDMDHLSAAEAQRVREQLDRLVQASRRSDAPVGADQFHYEVRVDGPGDAPRVIQVLDDGEWESPLPRALSGLAQSMGIALP